MGAYKSLSMKVGRWYVSGMEIMLIGIVSALLGWGIGFAFESWWK
jgi:hypothetical protein